MVRLTFIARAFPDGRVGSHSGLAKAEHGEKLLKAAAHAVAEDYLSFFE
jgi:creatinine amidohydrolase